MVNGLLHENMCYFALYACGLVGITRNFVINDEWTLFTLQNLSFSYHMACRVILVAMGHQQDPVCCLQTLL